MKILTRLNFANFRQNRVRTITTIIGISLSVMLVLTVVGVATSIWYSVIENARDKYGDYHIMYEDIPGDKLYILEESRYYDVAYYSERVDAVIDEDGVKHLYWIGPYPKESYQTIEAKDIIRDSNHQYNVFLKYKNIEKTKGIEERQTRALTDADCYPETIRVNIIVQTLEGDLGESGRILIWSLCTLVLGVMAIIAAFIIRNSFNISITERVRQFGMLSSVGARPRQIRHMVYQEALLIGLVAIPLGLLLGALLTWCVVLIVNNVLVDIMVVIGAEMVFFIPWQAVVVSFIVGLIIVFLSAASPAIVASRYSPIYALRSNQDIKIKARKVRTSKLTRKILGIGGVIARKNLKRSRQKYRTTVISIVLSVVALISVMSFMDYNHKIVDFIVVFTGANYIVGGGTDAMYEDIVDRFSIQEYAIYKELPIIQENEEEPLTKKNSFQAIIVSRGEFERLANEVGLKNADLSRSAILYNRIREYHSDGSASISRITSYKVGDEVQLKTAKIVDELTENGNTSTPSIKKKSEKITISAISDGATPLGYHSSYFQFATIFISEDYYRMDNIYVDSDSSNLYIADSGKGEQISQYLEQESVREKYGSSYHYEDMEKQTRVLKSTILLAEILTYGFIVIVSLIGITNIFNTITTNVALRAREFATLKSIGMTDKEFNRMIRLESAMYSTRALLIGLPIGILVSYGISKFFDTADTDFGWIFPWKAIIISIVSVAILIAVIMRYSVRKIKKQNIIETIRKESF